MLLVGRKDEEGNYIKDWYRQGWIFKDEDAFLHRPNDVCYIPEFSNNLDDGSEDTYSRNSIIDICDGDEKLAFELFYMLDWQHPETLYDETMREILEETM